MSKSYKRQYDDAEYYGRMPKAKEQPKKREPRNWKKVIIVDRDQGESYFDDDL